MGESFKNRNLLVIVFEILVIVLGIGGITFATSRLIDSRSSSFIKVGEYNLDYIGDSVVSANDLEPISDNLINFNTKDNVIRLEFSLRGVSTNKDADDLIYDVMMKDMNIDCALLNKYTKWNLYKNEQLISTGSLDPAFDGNVLSENMSLTNIQQDLPKYNEKYDKYVLIFWISEACENIETCELVDQSNIIGSEISMKVFIALSSGDKEELKRVPNYDTSCANRPELYNNMVAVTYDNGNWIVADTDNSSRDNLWYDYGKQKWANAVVVKENKYTEVGMRINEEDVLGYYVWIPRFKYKTWNVEDEVTDSYNAYDEGIDIIFDSTLSNNDVTNKNNVYLTHPVFSNNLNGFWISKYEISKNSSNYRFVSNTSSYRNDTLDNYKNISSMISSNYNLGSKVESHMINNLEWGAVAYLSHSKYGVCISDGCTSIGMNNSYKSGTNKQDTTTRNVYGVYDMAGGAGEYVLGNYTIGSATNEVILSNGGAWYNALSIVSDRDYIIRGGLERGMYYFGDINMSSVDNSTRVVLVNK